MSSELYDALLAAGAPEDKARAAAVAVVGYEERFHRIERDQAVLKWMVGFNLAISVAVLFKVFAG